MIRDFDLDRDLDRVLDLWRQAGPGVRLGASDTRDEIARKLARDPDLFLVAEDDGQIVGAVLGGFDGRRGMAYHLAVADGHRGRGLGTALMNELEARLRARGCHKCYLLATPENAQAVRFYRARGWDVMPMTLMGKVLE